MLLDLIQSFHFLVKNPETRPFPCQLPYFYSQFHLFVSSFQARPVHF